MADDVLDLDEELHGAGVQERDWKGIVTALMVILAICLTILTAIVIFAPLSAEGHVRRKKLTQEQLTKFQYEYERFHVTDQGDVIGESDHTYDVLVDKQFKKLLSKPRANFAGRQILSPSGKFIAELYPEFNPGDNKMNATFNVVIKRVNVSTFETQLWGVKGFVWHPDGEHFAVVRNNSVFFNNLVLSEDTGEVNGIFDWVYQEEIFTDIEAMWFSNDGKSLVYASHDLSTATNVTMRRYVPLVEPIDTSFSYPKVGDQNLPVYRLWLSDLQGTPTLLSFPLPRTFLYLFTVKWLTLEGVDKLVVTWADRYQQHLYLTVCDPTCKLVFEKKVADDQWLNPFQISKMQSEEHFVFLLLPRRIDDDFFQHIAKVNIWNGEVHFLPFDSIDILDILGVKNGKIYFTAAAPTPMDVTLWSAGSEGAETVVCETCAIPGCTYQKITFNAAFTSGTLLCSGPGPSDLKLLTLQDKLLVGDGNRNTSQSTNPTIIHRETIDGLDIKMILPEPLDELEKSTNSIPMFLYVYGGPEGKEVTHSNALGKIDYLASALNIAVISIDGRGSANHGWRQKSAIYGRLGVAEVEDQYLGLKLLAKKYSFLNFEKIAVYGWSYGGFMALRISQEYDAIRCAISIAPVVNFRYYDTAYTERYMGNSTNYVDVTDKLDNFKKTKLFLMHGLFDENVHFQNSALLIEALQKDDIDFELMVFPNQDHSLKRSRTMVSRRIESFLQSCLID